MARTVITLRKDGSQSVEVLDAAGPDCLRITEGYEKRAGVVLDRRLKDSYHEEPPVVVETTVEMQR
jgi:hypothetical protein